ncbi:NAD(P)H-binding protein [Streptomyces sp. NPDC051561]|uniref:NAD(P)H-binding protein n=1 Tax=Streptomyces sp. NPDC051561 TaxID=3365658 RepID=UPI00378CA5A2
MILVTGATGHIGGEVARQLHGAGRPVRALVREGRTSTGLPADLPTAVGDLNEPASLRAALEGVQGVFLLPGYADMPGVLAECERAGVRHVVLLSGLGAADGDLDNAVSRMMILSERAVSTSDVERTILRPSGFMSNTFEWAPQLRVSDVVRAAFPEVPIAMVDPYDVGAVAAHVLLDPAHFGLIHTLSGPEALRPADRVRVLGDALGRALRCEGLSDAEARKEMEAAGTPPQYVDAFFRYYADVTPGRLPEDSQVRTTVTELLGREPGSFAEWAGRNTAGFPSAPLPS